MSEGLQMGMYVKVHRT